MTTIPQARLIVANQIGLPASFDGSVDAYSNLSADQQTQLTRGLINYILNNPGEFTPEQVTTAQAEKGRAATMQTVDTSFSISDFGSEVLNNAIAAGNKVAHLGNGILDTASTIGTLLPVFALIAIALFALPYIRQQTK